MTDLLVRLSVIPISVFLCLLHQVATSHVGTVINCNLYSMQIMTHTG